MRQNGQCLIKYSGLDPDSVQSEIVKDWETAYQDCKIVTVSMVDGGHGLYHALVVFEELEG